MRTIVPTILLLLLTLLHAEAGEARYIYRVWLADKNGNTFSTDRPEEFLTAKAIERRERQGIAITEEDLPPSDNYIRKIEEYGGRAICRSRWLNTVTVESNSTRLAAKLKRLPFVNKTELIYEKRLKEEGKTTPVLQYGEADRSRQRNSIYGYSRQTELLGGTCLHSKGYRGKGITIAVLDAGFADADSMPEYIDTARLRGVYDTTPERADIFDGHTHGTSVLSVMLADKCGELVGTAPEADYILVRTEYFDNEYRQEEDFWVRGAEYADSIGADIISSSLGYTRFDATRSQYSADDCDGNTAVISRGAAAAARRGIMVVTGAGNTGHQPGQGPIPFPADACGILAVGSSGDNGEVSEFSSGGVTRDGRIRPDIIAPGENIAITVNGGRLVTASGTSYSAPAVAGLAACLMQAFPQCGAKEIIQLIEESSDRYASPEPPLGHGIPDFTKAFHAAEARYGAPDIQETVQ